MINTENFKQKTHCATRCQLRFYIDDNGRHATVHNGDKFELAPGSSSDPLAWLIESIKAEHE